MLNVLDVAFKEYGRVLNLDLQDLIQAMDLTPLPDDVVYEPSDKGLERTASLATLANQVYGEMDIQIGYCNGHNQLLNGLEYHKSSEINVAATDMILLLGRMQDIEEDFTYDTAKVEAFLVPKGTAVELYATTLHYAPCGVDGEGFRCAVVLPRGTNYPIDNEKHNVAYAEDKLLAATNKWLIAHEDAHIDGAFVGLKGINVSV